MHTRWLRPALLLLAVTAAGCARGTQVETPDLAPEDQTTKLGSAIDLDLVAALQLPRADQAKLATEWADTLQAQLKAARDNPESVDLLPKFLPPLAVAVFDQAKFSPAAGFSLPPYLDAGKQDAAVALHLARFGDHEAATKIAPDAVRGKLAAFRAEKNYPVEWTRLASIALISSQLKLASGDADGATQLVLLHKQLTEALDKKAAAGPLGAALLSPGKRALEAASVALRTPKRNKVALADDIDTAVREWEKSPAPAVTVAFASPAADVRAVFGTAQRGKAIVADTPASVARVIDLFGLPLAADGVQVAAAFLDDKDRLAEWQFAYRAKIDTLYTTPAQVAFRLTEAGFGSKDEVKSANLTKQEFAHGDTVCEVVRTNRSPALGGLVRVVTTKDPLTPASTRNLRDYGAVNFDRGFEANRVAAAPSVAGPLVIVKEAASLKAIASALETPAPDAVVLVGNKGGEVLDSLEMAWAPTENEHALDRLLPSIWDDYGPGKLDDVEDQAAAYLAFTWQNPTTKVQLRLAFDERGPVFSAKDTQPADKLAARVEAVVKRDEQERLARVGEGKAIERLVRSPGIVNDFSLNGLVLGQSKAAAEAGLPKGKAYLRKSLADGTSVVVLTNPDPTAAYWARQVLVRYDGGKVSEIRVRYQFGSVAPKKGESMLERLTDAKAGVPESVPAPWNGLWADLPAPGKIVYARWRDDRTIRSFQQDVGGIEVAWVERKPEPARPWLFVSNGIPGCKLEDTRAAVDAALKAPVATNEGAQVYRLPQSSPYEMALVWYQGERVTRVTCVHRERPPTKDTEIAKTLSQVWGKSLDSLGFICRQDGESRHVLGAYFWHDDKVRVQTSVRQDDAGPRLLTEWRYWPVAPAKTVATKPGEGE